MFENILIENFRTHRRSEIDLTDITLLIGSNNAGKSNLLVGIQHFARLTARARPVDDNDRYVHYHKQGSRLVDPHKLRKLDFFPHCHRLYENEPVRFSAKWSSKAGKVNYCIELYQCSSLPEQVGCKERITIACSESSTEKVVEHGYSAPSDEILLRTLIEQGKIGENFKSIASMFFRDFASCYCFNFQPSFLNGKYHPGKPEIDPNHLRIASQLGYEGQNLQRLLALVKSKENTTFDRFIASLRRFEPSFHGIEVKNIEEGDIQWLFDLGRNPPVPEGFWSTVISDGLLRAAAIALLTSMHIPPSLLLIEEIENGISQRNLGRFLAWLKQASGTPSSNERGYNTQFIITSHSPSILREFAEELDKVYHIRIDRKFYSSVIANLNSSLSAFVDMGTVEGRFETEGSKRRVKITPQKLVELWYSGTIGGEAHL